MNLAAMQALGAVQQPKAFYLPLDWLNAFQDTPLVWVLAAHAAAVPEGDPHAYVGVSENALAKQSGFDREYLRAKKRFLIERGFLEPRSDPRRGYPLPFRVSWQRIAEAVEKCKGLAADRQGVDGTPPGGLAADRQGVDGTPPGGLAADRQGVDGTPPGGLAADRQGEPPPYKERAPASSEAKELRSSKELAVKNQQIEEAISEHLQRSRLMELAGRKLTDGETLRNLRACLQRLAHDWQVREVLDILEDKCRKLAQYPSDKTWGWIVRAAQREVDARAGAPPERKPPEKADTADLLAEIHKGAKAMAMGGRR